MNKEEILEYLKKVDKLELRLDDEDKDTLQWLIFGYNECARLLYGTEQEIDRLNNVVNELEKWLSENTEKMHNISGDDFTTVGQAVYQEVLDKLKELKENK